MKVHLYLVLLAVGVTCAATHAAPPTRAPGPVATPPSMSWNQWVTTFHEYMDLIGSFAQIAKDRPASGVAAVVYADDILRTHPEQEAINYFLQVLPQVKDPAVRRAIQLRLADHYRLSNQPDKALEQLKQLMTAPPDTSPTTRPAGG
jgi:hypothetical protein